MRIQKNPNEVGCFGDQYILIGQIPGTVCSQFSCQIWTSRRKKKEKDLQKNVSLISKNNNGGLRLLITLLSKYIRTNQFIFYLYLHIKHFKEHEQNISTPDCQRSSLFVYPKYILCQSHTSCRKVKSVTCHICNRVFCIV